MTRKALLLALGLSLVFNGFVLVGFVRARAMHGPLREAARIRQRDGQPPISNRLARELKLNDEQAKMLTKLQEDQRQSAQVFDQSIALTRQGLNEEVRKENPDIERLRELVHEEADLFRQRRLSEANLFSAFMDQLTPEQRREFMKRIGRGGQQPPQKIPPRMLEQFDHNRSGKLEAEEWREARQEMDRRRREMPAQPFDQRPPRHEGDEPNRPMHDGPPPHEPGPGETNPEGDAPPISPSEWMFD